LKLLILFFGLVTKWLNNVSIEIFVPRDEFPESLSAEFQIIPFVRVIVFAITTEKTHPVWSSIFPRMKNRTPDGRSLLEKETTSSLPSALITS
jgi:hypothetical protein